MLCKTCDWHRSSQLAKCGPLDWCAGRVGMTFTWMVGCNKSPRAGLCWNVMEVRMYVAGAQLPACSAQAGTLFGVVGGLCANIVRRQGVWSRCGMHEHAHFCLSP